MKRILIAMMALSIFISCSDDKKNVEHNDLYFSNDLESVKGWMENNTLRKGDAHSGKFYSTTDSSWQYSLAFSLKAEHISSKPLRKADVSLWAYVKKPEFKGCIVTSVTRNDSMIFWNSSDLKNFYIKPDEWFKVTGITNFPNNLQGSDVVKIYLWNIDGAAEIRMDDMEIQFYN